MIMSVHDYCSHTPTRAYNSDTREMRMRKTCLIRRAIQHQESRLEAAELTRKRSVVRRYCNNMEFTARKVWDFVQFFYGQVLHMDSTGDEAWAFYGRCTWLSIRTPIELQCNLARNVSANGFWPSIMTLYADHRLFHELKQFLIIWEEELDRLNIPN